MKFAGALGEGLAGGETETLEKMEKRIEYDLDYLRRWSLWFDLKIILGMIFGILKTATRIEI
jgi:lipopolysaccharide/colanic/teichoic acid biosynthesis glycosyltransferase